MGDCGERIVWALEVEAAVSCDRATALEPGRRSKTVSSKTKRLSLYILINVIHKEDLKQTVTERRYSNSTDIIKQILYYKELFKIYWIHNKLSFLY